MISHLRRCLAWVAGSLRLPGGALLIHPGDRNVILTALEDASDYRLDFGVSCGDCDDKLCDDHAIDASIARNYDDLHARIQGRTP